MDPLVKRYVIVLHDKCFRQCFDDVLDLSRKSNHVDNDDNKLSVRNDDDVIMLSEDEDDRLLGALCDEMEKENTPKQSLLSKSRALLLKLENELRNEESTLVLLQQLRANQRSHALQPRSTKGSSNTTSTVRSTQSPVNQVRPAGQIAGRTVPSTTGNRATQSPAQNSTAINFTNATSIPQSDKKEWLVMHSNKHLVVKKRCF
uniref:SJCHGC07521 protein n=1 Tax=Schistosoma japonicum TaxID=6182 RepID=Q5DCT9_SCHJA|nr:SJCHGC07521 protein [Schistosoma japonicum]